MKIKNLRMKTAARAVLMCLLLLCVAGMTKSFAQTFTVGNLNYSINSDGNSVTVTGHINGTSATGSLTIPGAVSYGGSSYAVTTIGSNAFKGCNGLTGSLTIPNLVTTIGYRAFYNCYGFTGDLTLPNSVISIGNEAFYNCRGLDGIVVIPSSVTSIGSNAFAYCMALTELYFNATNCNTMGAYQEAVFAPNCNSLATLYIGNNVQTIPAYAFQGCSALTGVLTIPNGVTSIGDMAFANTSFTTINFNATNCTYMGSSNRKVFNNCSTPASLNIGSNVQCIPDYAFTNYSTLTGNLTLPNSLVTIGQYAFYYCTGLTGSLFIPNSVTSIGYCAFSNCNGFTGSLSVGNSVTSIGGFAFNGCNGFSGSLTIGNSVISIGNDAFRSCSGFTGNLVIPNTVTTINSDAFMGCSGFTGDLIIPNSVTTIGGSAFYGCSGLSGNLVIGNSLTTINGNTFYQCSGLSRVTFGNSVTEIKSQAFSYCSNISEIYSYANSLPTISQYEFYNTSKSIPVYVRSCLINDYQNAQGWSSFTNIQGTLPCPYPYYVTEGNWSEVSHWEGNALPETNDAVIIGANCNVNINVTIGSLTINNGKTLTVKEDKTLTVQGTLYNKGTASNFILENGSQLYHDTPLVQATVQKSIAAYSNSGGWNFVSSPVTFLTPSISNGLVSETETDYDLYYYHEPSHYWKNYKQLSYHAFYSGEGFLYANASNTTLLFSGNLHPGANGSFTTNNLSYSANVLTGWNLVGNPFPCNAYADRSYYVMNADGTAIEPNAVSSAIAIAPCTGIMVKATATGQSVTFSKTAPNGQSGSNGYLQIAVASNESKGSISEDKAIVSFNDGDELGKYYFGEQNANIYIPKNGKEYAIAYCDKQGEMPLNFKAAKNGEYTITVGPENVELNYLHLIDNMTGADVDLLASPEYTFTAKTTDYASRFRLVFSATGIEEYDAENGFAYFNGSEWVVANSENATLQVVDVMGRIVYCTDVARNVSTSGMPAGVYVLRLVNGDDVKTQKIVIP